MTRLDPIVGRFRVEHFMLTIFLQNLSSLRGTISHDLPQFAGVLVAKNAHIVSFPQKFPESWKVFISSAEIGDADTATSRVAEFAKKIQARRKKFRALCAPLFSCLELLSGTADKETEMFASGVNMLISRLGSATDGDGLDEIPTNIDQLDDVNLDVKARSIKLLQTQRELAIANMTKLSAALGMGGVDSASRSLGEKTLKDSKKEIAKYEERLSKLGAPVVVDDVDNDGNK